MSTKLLKLIVAVTVVCAITLMLEQAAIGQQKQVVRFMTNETDPPSIEFYKKAITEFEKLNPNIKIELEPVSTTGRLQKITASLAAKTMPDVFKLISEERFPFVQKGYLAPLDDVVKEIGIQTFVEGSITDVGGRVYDLPYTLGLYAFWYREDLLKAAGIKPPKNWDELRSAAKALTKGDTYGFVFPAGKNRATAKVLSPLIWSAGGTYFDKNLNVTFNNPGTVAALSFLKEMAEYSPKGIASYSYGDVVNSFLTGKVAMTIHLPRLIANAWVNSPDLASKISAAPIPAGPSGIGVNIINVDTYAVASASVGGGNVEVAKKFLKFLVTGERVIDFSLTAFPHLIPPMGPAQKDLIEVGASMIGGRKDIARVCFDATNSLDFDNEAGATIVNGVVKKSGVINPYITSVIARNIPAEVVQKVVLQGEDPVKAAAWGADQMKLIVDEVKPK